MATQYGIQPAFSRGEISPRLHARIDIDQWRVALAKAENWLVMRHGGLRRRPGTQFVAMTKAQAANDKVRSLPFEFSPEQSYVLELGHLSMRVLGLGGQVVVGGLPYEIATPWAGIDLASLQFQQSGDEIYVVHPGYAPRKIRRRGETNWQIVPVAFEDGPYLEVNDTATKITPGSTGHITPAMTGPTTDGCTATSSGQYVSATNPWNAFDRDSATEWSSNVPNNCWLKFDFASPKIVSGYSIQCSSALNVFADNVGNAVTITKVPGYLRAPRAWVFQGTNDGVSFTTLDTRSGETGWGEAERRYYTFENESAYLSYRIFIYTSNTSDRPCTIAELNMQGAGVDAQVVTLTADAVTGVNNGSGFLAGDVGRHFRFLGEDAYWHWFDIVTVANSTQVTARLRSPPLATVASSTNWRLGAFGMVPGYPAALDFFLGRLCYGGTKEKPLTIYGSQVNDFDAFGQSIPLQADDAFTFTIGAGGKIEWLLDGGDVLIIGTGQAIRSLGPASKSEPFGPRNVQQGKPAFSGAAPIQTAKSGQTPIFVNRYRSALREATYSFDAQGFAAPDISVMSEHLFRSRILGIDYAQDPNQTIWSFREDGALVAMTYEKEQQMTALTPHRLGGDGVVESLCVIPGADRHEVWMIVRRERRDGSTMRTHERMAADFEGQPIEKAYFVDCGISYEGSPTTSLGDLDHLNGFEVGMLADGAEQDLVEVSNGEADIPDGVAASVVHVGLLYRSHGKTLRIAQGMGDGSGLGRKKRIKAVYVDVMETGGLKVKGTSRSFEDVLLRQTDEVMGAPPELVTDMIKTSIDDQWGGQGVVEFLADGVMPATIRAIMPMFDGEP